MERNVDKIKQLKHELGRYQKKVMDQAKEIDELRRMLRQANAGMQETQTLVDAVLTAVALEHGEQATDPDEPEKVLGWRLSLPRFSALEMREKYELHARRDEEKDLYILGVAERRAEDAT